jgi:NlpC/P60 family
MMLTIAVAAGSSSAIRRCIALAAASVALVLLVASMLTLTLDAWPTAVLAPRVEAGADLPLDQWLLMQQAAAASGCGLDWSILAGLEKEETDFGRNPRMFEPHDGGIVGLVQMQPGNWALFAPPGGNPFDQHDALNAAAKFLCAQGAASDIRSALLAYNHLDSYVVDVLNWAEVYASLMGPTLGTGATGASASGLGAEVVRVAETWKGVPYRWGGASRAGVDCSGLVMLVFAHFGVQLPHNAQLQYNAVPHIHDDRLQPGDLVFFSQTYPSSEWITHVGIYVGDGLQINAPTEGQVVSVQPVFSGFWGAHYSGAGRVPLPSRPATCPVCG